MRPQTVEAWFDWSRNRLFKVSLKGGNFVKGDDCNSFQSANCSDAIERGVLDFSIVIFIQLLDVIA